MKHRLLILFTFLIAGTLSSCESTTTAPNTTPDSTAIVKSGDRAVFIGNEGGGSENSSVDAVIFRSQPVADTIKVRNVLTHLGEVNDIRIVGNRAYVVDNASNQLIVLNADSLKEEASLVLGTNGPNKVVQIAPNELLVTQRASNSAAIVSMTTNTVVDSIPAGLSNAAAGALDGNVWISTSIYQKPGAISCYQISNKTRKTMLQVVSSPEEVFVDSTHDQIVVACMGDYNSVPPVIYFIDGTTLAIRDSLVAGAPGSLQNTVFGDRLYLIEGNTVEAVDLTSHIKTSWLMNSTNTYYNGGYDPKDHALYLGRSDYTGETMVDVYSASTAALKWSFPAGIAPAHFAFYH